MGCTESKTLEKETSTMSGQADNRTNDYTVANVTASARISTNVDGSTKVGRTKMGNVFATPLDILGIKEGHTIPIHAKSSEETDFLKEKLSSNFIFEHLTRKELNRLVDAFEKTEVTGGGSIIINQGDVGDYFYVLYSGSVEFVVNENSVGNAQTGTSFGELALLYKSPRAATVKTIGDNTVLFRVDQLTFRYILQAQTKEAAGEKVALLKMVSFLKDLNTNEINKLAAVMTPKKFSTGDYIMRKGDAADFFYILGEGSVTAKNVAVGEAKFEDLKLDKRGDYFGERALVTGEPRAADIVADNEVTAFAIDKDTFESVLGNYNKIILRAQEKRVLEGIKIISDSKLDEAAISSLVTLLEEKTFKAGEKIYTMGDISPPAIYLVRSGEVLVEATETRVGTGGYFGDEQLLADVTDKESDDYPAGTPPSCTPTSTVSAMEDCAVAILSLAACRNVFNTRKIGTPGASEVRQVARDVVLDSPIDKSIKMNDLKKQKILGQGTFGQVWLVSRKTKAKKDTAYALKIQSKFELIRDGQAQAVVYEKNVMMQLNHPLILPLINTYQDKDFVYMLLGLVQGGELYSYIHRKNGDGVQEHAARFYAAGIGEVLGFMHRKGFVYRDLKAENVLIDNEGYPILIDFGFAKIVTEKTFTLCGTPLYLPPEVILNRGHNHSADHWSLGVLIYEMLFGDTPFYQDGMQQMDLFRSIVKGKYTIPSTNKVKEPVSANVTSIIAGFLTKAPAQRLGSLAGGEDDILEHPWFGQPIPGSTDDVIDFSLYRQKTIPAPTVPKIRNPLDASNFEDWSHLGDKTRTLYPNLTPEQAKIFAEF